MSSLFAALLFMCSVPGYADDRTVRLAVPDRLVETGLLRFVLPRFSLKTQIRVELVPPAARADASLGQSGEVLFEGQGEAWALAVHSPDHVGTQTFQSWITSEVGLRTITDFKINDAAVFRVAQPAQNHELEITFEGNAALGRELSVKHCGRCHVSAEGHGMAGIGSTPSFFVLRAMDDWDLRFQTFFALNPHPAFTQIEDVTEPFPVHRPSPIAPVELTVEEFEAILAYVSKVRPADLGAPLEYQ